jgi:hypothetical protein
MFDFFTLNLAMNVMLDISLKIAIEKGASTLER